MTPVFKAQQIFGNHHFEISEHGDESGQEILISILAIKASIVTVESIIEFMINDLEWDVKTNGNIAYWLEVKDEIKMLFI